MLRRITDLVFAICLAGWFLLLLLLCMTIVSQGWSGVVPKLMHVAGFTSNLGVQSWGLVAWRLVALLVITLGVGSFRWYERKQRRA